MATTTTKPVTRRIERLELDDGDFLDLEWADAGSPRLAILSHGLEGSTRAPYIQGMARAFVRRGWDVLAWNLRGCGITPNRLPKFYHSGATDDLSAVVKHALNVHPCEQIDMVGFSLGGNLMLKYLGERPHKLPSAIRSAAAFSVPCDLECSAKQLSSRENIIYMRRFLRDLERKLRAKAAKHPDAIDLSHLRGVRTFQEFDDYFTAPLHGFRDASDYWLRSSCRQFLPSLTIPVLLVNALNDPFLGPRCFPREEAIASHQFHLETPTHGGHVGFPAGNPDGEYWHELRATDFFSAL